MPGVDPDQAAVDTTVLERLCAAVGDTAVVRAVVDRFLAELPGRVAAVREAANGAQLARAAHALASPSATIGARVVADVCRALETLGESGRDDAAGRAHGITRLEAVTADAVRALRAWSAGQAG
jgi:HPt (histidine-containing phosphotransfer) domain-containing protein